PIQARDKDGNLYLYEDKKILVVYTGKIDMAIERRNERLICDHKTTSMGGGGFFDEFYISAQFKGYNWAAQQIMGKVFHGALVNALVNRPPTKKGFSLDFLRDTIYFTPAVIEEWATSTLVIVSDFLHNCQREFFPMHTMWCKAKYGKCDFFDVC